MKKTFMHSIIAAIFCMSLISISSIACTHSAKAASSKEAVATQSEISNKSSANDSKHAKSHSEKTACASCAGGDF